MAELVPIRHARMATSPFAFFRGAAAIMAADLASTPRSGLDAQLCGDAHLANFGGFASPDRDVVFSINDFDESLPGPWEWDVKRLAASTVIAGRERGFGAKQRRAIVRRHGHGVPRRDAGVRASTRSPGLVRAPRRRRHARALAIRSLRHDGSDGTAIRRQGPDARQHRRVLQAHSRRGRRAPHHQRSTADRPHRRAARGRGRHRGGEHLPHPPRPLPRQPPRRPTTPARPVPLRPPRPEGGRRRQRRHQGVDRPTARTRSRPTLHAGQRSIGVGAGPVHRPKRVRQPGPAGGRRPTPDAGRQRHLPRLVPRARHRRRCASRLLRPPAVGLEDLRRHRAHVPRRDGVLRPGLRLDARPGPRPLRGPHRHRLLPRLQRRVRLRRRRVRRVLRRSERARPRRACSRPSRRDVSSPTKVDGWLVQSLSGTATWV